jgi:ABC-type branched-subunit amino acid transport system ATPase component
MQTQRPLQGAAFLLIQKKTMTFDFAVPTSSGEMKFQVAPGTSLLFVGPNGGGKTRLAVLIEEALGSKAHRISAHRALSLNPSVAKVNEQRALDALRTGNDDDRFKVNNRSIARWRSKAATLLLNDYDYLVQALFADQVNISLVAHKNARTENYQPAQATKFEKLIEIWDCILPLRKLDVSGDDIQVTTTSGRTYPAAEMSDGERAIFYLIGQTLVAAPNSLILFDEPELHIHRSIMSRLWDALEAARPDCAMILISHDLEFVASREGRKYVLRDYDGRQTWAIEALPEDTGFPQDITTLILGSRKPILFVEGTKRSLDRAIYRACYPDWTIIPRSSCEEVIHAVVTMRANGALTGTKCSGIVDADAYDASEIEFLNSKGIAVLPVSEIENIFLLPEVVEAIARAEGFDGQALEEKLSAIFDELFEQAKAPRNQLPAVLRHCRRRIDRTLKKLDLKTSLDVSELASEYAAKTKALDVAKLAKAAEDNIQKAIAERNVPNLLRWYDNKGILGIVCKVKGTTKSHFEQWIIRALRNNCAPAVCEAIRKVLSPVVAS